MDENLVPLVYQGVHTVLLKLKMELVFWGYFGYLSHIFVGNSQRITAQRRKKNILMGVFEFYMEHL